MRPGPIYCLQQVSAYTRGKTEMCTVELRCLILVYSRAWRFDWCIQSSFTVWFLYIYLPILTATPRYVVSSLAVDFCISISEPSVLITRSFQIIVRPVGCHCFLKDHAYTNNSRQRSARRLGYAGITSRVRSPSHGATVFTRTIRGRRWDGCRLSIVCKYTTAANINHTELVRSLTSCLIFLTSCS